MLTNIIELNTEGATLVPTAFADPTTEMIGQEVVALCIAHLDGSLSLKMDALVNSDNPAGALLLALGGSVDPELLAVAPDKVAAVNATLKAMRDAGIAAWRAANPETGDD